MRLPENKFLRLGPLILNYSNDATVNSVVLLSYNRLQMLLSFLYDILSFFVSKLALLGGDYRSIDLKMSADRNV